MDPRSHWQSVYERKHTNEVSWYQREPTLSHALIRRVAPPPDSHVLDVGGGASTLVDALLASGYMHVSVLDIAPAALARARERLGSVGGRVTWIAEDILATSLEPASVDVWHDRAVFHFLRQRDDQKRYVAQVQRAVRPGGHVLVATFAEDGPTWCSGLEVSRYSAAQLHGAFGPGFQLESSTKEDHLTPIGVHQAFTYCLCRLEPGLAAR